MSCDRTPIRTARRFRRFPITGSLRPATTGPLGFEPRSPGLEPGVLPLHHGPSIRPAGLEPAASAVAGRHSDPLSYGRVKSLRQESNPHLGRTKGACLPLTLRRRKVETAGLEPASSRCKRGALPVELRPQREVRTGGFEPPKPEATGLQPVELANARRPHEGWPTGFEPAPRRSRPRDAAATPQPPRRGRPDSNRRPLARQASALAAELRPQKSRKAGSAPRNRRQRRCLYASISPAPIVAHRHPCQCVSAPPPPHRIGLEASRSQSHVTAHALRSRCSVTSSTTRRASILKNGVARVGFEPTVSSS
jgi:hypothetical protein